MIKISTSRRTSMNNEELINIAKTAMTNSYSPYSQFKVGAAALCDDGSVYTGCNIENASYGATVCAERVALFASIADGNKSIKKIAIVSSSDKYTFPCGMCRQVMAEFMQGDGIIVLSEGREIREYSLEKLIPNSFQLSK